MDIQTSRTDQKNAEADNAQIKNNNNNNKQGRSETELIGLTRSLQ